MNYRESWDLSTIPDRVLFSELGRRRHAKRKTAGNPPTCDCGICLTCRNRKWKQESRERKRTKSR